MAHQEVHAVGGPAEAEHALLAQAREQTLQRNEDQCEEEYVEQEPVEAEIERLVEARVDLHLRAAQQGREPGQREAGEPEGFLPAQQQVQATEQEGEADDQLHQCAHEAHGIGRAKLLGRQPFWKVQHGHRAESAGAEEYRDGAAQPARAEVGRRVVAEGALEPAFQRRALRRFVVHDRRAPIRSTRTAQRPHLRTAPSSLSPAALPVECADALPHRCCHRLARRHRHPEWQPSCQPHRGAATRRISVRRLHHRAVRADGPRRGGDGGGRLRTSLRLSVRRQASSSIASFHCWQR